MLAQDRSKDLMMQIIVIRSQTGKVLTINVSAKHTIALCGMLIAIAMFCGLGMTWVSFNHGQRLPVVNQWLESASAHYLAGKENTVRQDIQAIGVRLGELQAQMIRLDVLGERLSKQSGANAGDINFKQLPGRGGAYRDDAAKELSLGEIKQSIEQLKKSMDKRGDALSLYDNELQQISAAKTRIPSVVPVQNVYSSSTFGSRVDPFTGKSTQHDGIDFNAPVGTPINAAAGGLVITASFHPQYGNMLEIDHGNHVVSRYAHASRLLVKSGEVVKRGQKIAEIGTTGRTTGAHLHFEVRVNDSPVNPDKYLNSHSFTKPSVTQARPNETVAQSSN